MDWTPYGISRMSFSSWRLRALPTHCTTYYWHMALHACHTYIHTQYQVPSITRVCTTVVPFNWTWVCVAEDGSSAGLCELWQCRRCEVVRCKGWFGTAFCRHDSLGEGRRWWTDEGRYCCCYWRLNVYSKYYEYEDEVGYLMQTTTTNTMTTILAYTLSTYSPTTDSNRMHVLHNQVNMTTEWRCHISERHGACGWYRVCKSEERERLDPFLSNTTHWVHTSMEVPVCLTNRPSICSPVHVCLWLQEHISWVGSKPQWSPRLTPIVM